MAQEATYDRIGHGYGSVRRPDRRLAARIWRALGDARSVVNVGAGAGSYEPADRRVIAVEPSAVMRAQRPAGAAPAVAGSAEELPLADRSVDAAMAVLSVQHWQDVERGLSEMLRVACRRVVLVTIDASVLGEMWLVREYFPQILDVHAAAFPAVEELLRLLPNSRAEAMAVPRDCADGFLAALWGRPEAHLDKRVRAASSAWHQLAPADIEHGLGRLGDDLSSGAWDRRHGALRHRAELDVGLRLVVGDRAPEGGAGIGMPGAGLIPASDDDLDDGFQARTASSAVGRLSREERSGGAA